MGTISDIFLAREAETLSPYAFHTSNTQGRMHPYTPCPNRTEFQRDRDKIIHSKSFRRLMHKTQVFLSPVDEHYRTRMTHTLEVTQIARIIARALNLNEDLTEAAALGHDLGHTPFGHAGERAMQQCFESKFTHYEQSLRVVDLLENEGRGLNLTYEVRDGILNHQEKRTAQTLEGIVVKLADKIAYVNHDLDDACRAGILSLDDVPREIFEVLGRKHGDRINRMVSAVITYSSGKNMVEMEPQFWQATENLKHFLFERAYSNPLVKAEEDKAIELLKVLFDHYVKHPEQLPSFYYQNIERDGIGRCVCDFVAGMTDRYAINTYANLFIPSGWKGLGT